MENSTTLPAPCTGGGCVCGLVHDETATRVDASGWITQRAYREQHGVSPTELKLTHTYCPKCFAQVQESVRQFFRKTG